MSIGDVLTVVELEEGIPSPHTLELIAMAHAIAELHCNEIKLH